MPEIGYKTTGRRAAILGLGGYVPEQKVSNAELSLHLDTSDEWIRQRTGIAERRVAVTGATNLRAGAACRPPGTRACRGAALRA